MSTTKEEAVYKTQLRHLQVRLKRCDESIQQKEKAVAVLRAKCTAIEQDTGAMEYLKFEISSKDQRLKELQEQHEKKEEEFRREQQEIDERNARTLQELQDEEEEMTTHLRKRELEHKATLMDLQKQVQSRRAQLAQNKEVYDAQIKELREEKLNPDMVASVLNETEEEEEKRVREEFVCFLSDKRENHQMWRRKLEFMQAFKLQLGQQREDLSQQLEQDKDVLLDMDLKLREVIGQNRVDHQREKMLKEQRDELQDQVQDVQMSLDDDEPRLKLERERLCRGIAKKSEVCAKQQEEIERLKAEVEAERSRALEADLVLQHITQQ